VIGFLARPADQKAPQDQNMSLIASSQVFQNFKDNTMGERGYRGVEGITPVIIHMVIGSVLFSD